MTAIAQPALASDSSKSSIIPNSPWRVVKITDDWSDFDDLEEVDDYLDATIVFSAQVNRVDYGPHMFDITINADVIHGPDGIPTRIGRLTAYRLHDPAVECDLEDGDLSEHFWTFDAISSDAACAVRDLIAAQEKVCAKFAKTLPYGGCDNLVYVDKMFVEPAFRGHGLARAMMCELRDQLVGAPSLVFFQAMPFISEVKAPKNTPEWDSEQARVIEAMTRYWVGADDLNFFQPKPRKIKELITGFWAGDSDEEFEPRSLTLWLEDLEDTIPPHHDPVERTPAHQDMITQDSISVPLSLVETALSRGREALEEHKGFSKNEGIPFSFERDCARMSEIEAHIAQSVENRLFLSTSDMTMVAYHADQWKMRRRMETILAEHIA